MKKEKSPSDTLNKGLDVFIPSVSVDCIILGFNSGRIKVLLCKFKASDKWMVPSGFLAKDEDPDESAKRVLAQRTGLEDVYLKQFYFFGRKGRVGVDDNVETLRCLNVYPDRGNCYLDRFISLGYYSLIKYDDARLGASDHEDVAWFDIDDTPILYVDHKELIDIAIITIRRQIGFIPIGFELLPSKFTMPELRSIYEAILGRELDRRNFQRKMLSIGYIRPLNETRRVGAHKSPNLYAFIKDKYEEAEKYGIQMMSNNL